MDTPARATTKSPSSTASAAHGAATTTATTTTATTTTADAPPPGRTAPMPRKDPILGHLRIVRERRLETFQQLRRELGDVFRFELPQLSRGGPRPFVVHVVAHPDHVRHVLQENNKNYSKQTRGYDQLRVFFGNGLLTSEGAFWLRQRRIAQPAFHRQRIAGFGAAMVRAADELAARWRADAEAGRVVDVSAAMMRLTLRVVSETLLGTTAVGDMDRVAEATTFLLEMINARLKSPVQVPIDVPLPSHLRFKKHVAMFDELMYGIIAARRARPAGDDDLLGMFMSARDEETGESMNDRQLRDEVLTMYMAGHETTANALAWTFYLLSLHPEVDRRLAAELAAVLGDALPTVDDVPKLTYTRMVVQEAMRLYPPVWMVGRQAVERDVIGGFEIPAKSLVFVSPWLTHHHPDLWENPEGFDPERFTPERSAGRAPFAYFPFGGGPRVCIGNNFAMLEAVLLLATLARRLRLDLVPGHRVEPEPIITLRPKRGVPMTVHARA